MKNYYQVLNLHRDATPAEIRKRWRELARKYHPDHNPDDPLAEATFKDVQEAYHVLSDATLKSRYDSGDQNRLWSEAISINNYFFARVESSKLMCFEETVLVFTWSGTGRVFRKPEMPDVFVTGSPFITQRQVIHEGQSVKETSLSYIICPLKPGEIEIPPASITINHIQLHTQTLSVSSTPNYCRFSKGNPADGKPYKLTMHYEYLPGEEPFLISEIKKNHTILVPRSKVAYVFHSIGSAMKIFCTIWVMIKLSQWFHLNIFIGLLAGNLFAGLNCHLMYALAGIKSKYESAQIYDPAREYGSRGYFLGESTGIPLISGNFWYYFGRLFL